MSDESDHGDRQLTLGARTWMRLGVRRREAVAPARLDGPLSDARLAVVSTGGATLPDQEPFDTGKTGDASFREIPSDTALADLRFDHPHYDTALAREDPDCVFPLRLVRTLAEEGVVGEPAPTAFSMMGYVPLTRELTAETAPRIGELMQGEEVDAALLCPA